MTWGCHRNQRLVCVSRMTFAGAFAKVMALFVTAVLCNELVVKHDNTEFVRFDSQGPSINMTTPVHVDNLTVGGANVGTTMADLLARSCLSPLASASLIARF